MTYEWVSDFFRSIIFLNFPEFLSEPAKYQAERETIDKIQQWLDRILSHKLKTDDGEIDIFAIYTLINLADSLSRRANPERIPDAQTLKALIIPVVIVADKLAGEEAVWLEDLCYPRHFNLPEGLMPVPRLLRQWEYQHLEAMGALRHYGKELETDDDICFSGANPKTNASIDRSDPFEVSIPKLYAAFQKIPLQERQVDSMLEAFGMICEVARFDTERQQLEIFSVLLKLAWQRTSADVSVAAVEDKLFQDNDTAACRTVDAQPDLRQGLPALNPSILLGEASDAASDNNAGTSSRLLTLEDLLTPARCSAFFPEICEVMDDAQAATFIKHANLGALGTFPELCTERQASDDNNSRSDSRLPMLLDLYGPRTLAYLLSSVPIDTITRIADIVDGQLPVLKAALKDTALDMMPFFSIQVFKALATKPELVSEFLPQMGLKVLLLDKALFWGYSVVKYFLCLSDVVQHQLKRMPATDLLHILELVDVCLERLTVPRDDPDAVEAVLKKLNELPVLFFINCIKSSGAKSDRVTGLIWGFNKFVELEEVDRKRVCRMLVQMNMSGKPMKSQVDEFVRKVTTCSASSHPDGLRSVARLWGKVASSVIGLDSASASAERSPSPG
jgi:hypothetical protein